MGSENLQRQYGLQRGGGSGKKFNTGPERRNVAEETENERQFALIGK